MLSRGAPFGRLALAHRVRPVIHDHLYAVLRKYYHSGGMSKETWKRGRELSDKVFLLGMQAAEPKVSSFKMYSAYYSVRMFGRWPASAKA